MTPDPPGIWTEIGYHFPVDSDEPVKYIEGPDGSAEAWVETADGELRLRKEPRGAARKRPGRTRPDHLDR